MVTRVCDHHVSTNLAAVIDGCDWDFWVLWCCLRVYMLPVHAVTVKIQASGYRFKWAKISQYLLEICHVAQYLGALVGAWPSHVHCKAIVEYLRALEGRRAAWSCPFIPELPPIKPLDNKQYHKWCFALLWRLLSWFTDYWAFYYHFMDIIEACESSTTVAACSSRLFAPTWSY